MSVWAVEVCWCKHETGFAVYSLHESQELAQKAFVAFRSNCRTGHITHYDDARVREWQVEAV